VAQSAARDLGPQGIHVAHVIVDGLIDTERVAGMMGAAKDDDSVRRCSNPLARALIDEQRLDPDSIASTFVHLAEQERSCWTFELDVRPWKETF
jgi:NAD(P)-dependent dehydrogenase (short-subunit alcohol dehydrogenase family)